MFSFWGGGTSAAHGCLLSAFSTQCQCLAGVKLAVVKTFFFFFNKHSGVYFFETKTWRGRRWMCGEAVIGGGGGRRWYFLLKQWKREVEERRKGADAD